MKEVTALIIGVTVGVEAAEHLFEADCCNNKAGASISSLLHSYVQGLAERQRIGCRESFLCSS